MELKERDLERIAEMVVELIHRKSKDADGSEMQSMNGVATVQESPASGVAEAAFTELINNGMHETEYVNAVIYLKNRVEKYYHLRIADYDREIDTQHKAREALYFAVQTLVGGKKG